MVVDMRTRPRAGGALDGNERITAFMNELQKVQHYLMTMCIHVYTVCVEEKWMSGLHLDARRQHVWDMGNAVLKWWLLWQLIQAVEQAR